MFNLKHDSLLDHIESEELSPAERAAAWAEYEAERTHGYTTHINQAQQQQQALLLKLGSKSNVLKYFEFWEPSNL